MKRIYVTTVTRGPLKTDANALYCIDFDTGIVISKMTLNKLNDSISKSSVFKSIRGGRGMTFFNGGLYLSTFNSLSLIDESDLSVISTVSFDGCQDIHQIYTINGKILITSTANDSEFTWDGINLVKIIDYGKTFQGLSSRIGHINDTVHFNSRSANYAILNSAGQIVNVNTMMSLSSQYPQSHDIYEIGNNLLINDTNNDKTIIIDNTSGTLVSTIYEVSGNPWVRGLSYISGLDIALIGIAPATVVVVSDVTTTPTKTNEIQISTDQNESIFDIVINPSDWDQTVQGKS